MTKNRVFRTATVVMALLFSVSAGLQYNDPDPALWMAVYLGAAVACFGPGRPRWVAPMIVGVVSVAWAAGLATTVFSHARPADFFASMDDGTAHAEISRELGGLIIVSMWMAVCALAYRRAHNGRRGSSD